MDRPIGFQEVEAPRFQDDRHMKVVRLSALRTGHLYPTGIIPGTHFCWRLSQSRGHSAAGRIMSMKNSSDTIRNWTRDLPLCSTVPQPNAPPRTPKVLRINNKWPRTPLKQCFTHFSLWRVRHFLLRRLSAKGLNQLFSSQIYTSVSIIFMFIFFFVVSLPSVPYTRILNECNFLKAEDYFHQCRKYIRDTLRCGDWLCSRHLTQVISLAFTPDNGKYPMW
jgi:hypothetical protein